MYYPENEQDKFFFLLYYPLSFFPLFSLGEKERKEINNNNIVQKVSNNLGIQLKITNLFNFRKKY